MEKKFLWWRTTIAEVGERSMCVGGRVNQEGKAELYMESGGWFLQFGNISISTGETKPPFAKGDRVRVIIEEDTEDANTEAKS